MENPDRNYISIEVFASHISRIDVLCLFIITIIFFISLGLRVMYPGGSALFTFIHAIIFIVFAASVVIRRRMATMLTRDAFIQTQPQGVVPWDDIYRIEAQKRGVVIHYKKGNSTKKLTSYVTDEKKKQFMESLKKASGIYGFPFEEKTK